MVSQVIVFRTILPARAQPPSQRLITNAGRVSPVSSAVLDAAEAIKRSRAASYKSELVQIYREHDPENMQELNRLLVQYADHLDKLLDGVRAKYGLPDPYREQKEKLKKQDAEIDALKQERRELKDQMDLLLQQSASKKACWFC